MGAPSSWLTMSSVAPPHQNREAFQPIRYDTITLQLLTLGDNCNDMLGGPTPHAAFSSYCDALYSYLKVSFLEPFGVWKNWSVQLSRFLDF